MNGRRRSVRTWPAWLGIGSVFALVAALVAEASIGWDLLCWTLLLLPFVVIVLALWPRRAVR